MTITEKERKLLLDHIIGMQFDLGVLAYNLDSTEDAKTVGSILQHLSIIANNVIHSKTLTKDIDEELFF